MSEFSAMVSRNQLGDILKKDLLGKVQTVTLPDFPYEPNPNMPLVVAHATEDEVIAMIVKTQATPLSAQGLANYRGAILNLQGHTAASSLADIASVTIYGDE